MHHSAWFSGDQYSVLVLCVHHLVTVCDIIVSGSVLTLYCIRVCLVLSHDKLLYLSSAVCLPVVSVVIIIWYGSVAVSSPTIFYMKPLTISLKFVPV